MPKYRDDLYLSLAQEMQKPLGTKKGNPWRNRLPTPLTILQAESIGLEVAKALPCVGCDTEEIFDDNLGDFCNEDELFGFKPNGALIGQANTPETPEE